MPLMGTRGGGSVRGFGRYGAIPITPINYVGTRIPTGYVDYSSTPSYANNQFVMVTEQKVGSTTGYYCFSSSNGIDWTLRSSSVPSMVRVNSKIIYTAAGYYVAICNSPRTTIMYSTDLVTWSTKVFAGTSFTDLDTDGTNIAMFDSTSQNLYYINSTNPTGSWTQGSVSYGGTASLDYWGTHWYTVGDSVTTIRRASSITGSLTTVHNQASGNGFGGRVVANSKSSPSMFVTKENTTGNVLYSSNGSSWSLASGTNLVAGQTVSVDTSTGYFYCLKSDYSTVSYTTNGSSWTSVAANVSPYPVSVAAGGGVALCVGSGISRSTNNGSSWTNLNTTYGNPYGLPRGIAYGGGRWVVNISESFFYPDGTVATNGPKIGYSTDLSSWTAVSLNSLTPGNNLTSMSYANGKFWTWGQSSCLLSSSDAVTWSKSTGTISNAVYTVVGDGSSTLVAPTGGSSDYYYSTNNGSSWTAATWTSSAPMYGAAFGSGRFVAVGWNGAGQARIAYGTNGSSWTFINAPAGTDNVLTGVTWSSGANLFLATMNGSNNKYLTSPDGINWTLRTAPTNVKFYNQSGHVLGDALGFVIDYAVHSQHGYGGWQSTDGINWTSFGSLGITGATPGITGESRMTPTQANVIASNGTTRVFSSNDSVGLLRL
jgi:hypothetical protein